jgi:hypothetical protein
MAISRASTSNLNSISTRSLNISDSNKGVDLFYSGGSGWINESFFYTEGYSSTTTVTAATNWNGSNQGTYFGGSQSTGAGGTGSWSYTINNGVALPAGLYLTEVVMQLDLNSPSSHDGMEIWAINTTTFTKEMIARASNPNPDATGTQLTKGGSFYLANPGVIKIFCQVYDGSTAYAMGGRIYSISIKGAGR